MGWADSGDTKTVMVEGVIPLVLGISLGFLSFLYCLGILKLRCMFSCIDDQVAPAIVRGEHQRQGNDGTPMSLAAAEKAFGPVACQAQLYGMEPKERLAVLESVLTPFCSTHKPTPQASSIPASTEVDNETGSMDSSENSGGNTGLDTSCACAICLREYEDGEELMTGTQCHHLFHKNCAMVWLTHTKRPKDHCPYCRNEMLTAAEMKDAAIELLGEERVKQLSHIPEADNNHNNNTITANSEPVEVVETPDIEQGVIREMTA